jgi:hypothetical protein
MENPHVAHKLFATPVGGGRAKPVYVQLYPKREPKRRKNQFKLEDFIEEPPPLGRFVLSNWFSKSRPSETYINLIKSLGYDPGEVLKFELKGFLNYRCGNKDCIVGDFYVPMANAGKFHPWRSFKHSERVVSQTMAKLEALHKISGFDYLITIDLTFPKDISMHLLNAGDRYELLHLVNKVVSDFMQGLESLLFYNRGSSLGGFFSVHIWRTSSPCEAHLHIHLNLPNVALGKDKKFYRFSPRIRVMWIKEAWRDSLEKYGLWSDSAFGYPDVFISFRRFKHRDKIAHRIRYCFRRPLVDLNKKLKAVELIEDNHSFVKFLLAYVPRRHNLGWFANFKGLRIIVSNRKVRRSVLCPVCGAEADFIGAVGVSECQTLSWIWFDRYRIWHEEDRPP